MLGGALAGMTVPAFADPVTITLGSWRTEDLAVWQDKILPVFMAAHPDIKVEFAPINTNEYNAAIQSQIEGGAGPDLITCRPFDVNNEWIGRGYFTKLDGLAGLENYTDTAKAAWSTGGSTYCVPVAAVLAGFYYNIDIFNELGLKVPTTSAEFIDVLQKIKDNGKYAPLAEGTAESWQLAYNGLYSIGPAYWKGEEGRLGLIDGTKKLTDPDFVAAFKAYAAWKPFLPAGYEALGYADMTQLFTLGKAAILPDGSWDINQVTGDRSQCRRLRAAGGRSRRRALPPGNARHGDRHQRQERQPGSRQDLPDLGHRIGVPAALRQHGAGLLRDEQPARDLRQQARPGLRRSEERRQAYASPCPRPAERRNPAARRRDLAAAAGDDEHRPDARAGRRRAAEGLASWYKPQMAK